MTNWSVIPRFPEFFHLRQALVDYGFNKLHHLPNLGWEVEKHSCTHAIIDIIQIVKYTGRQSSLLEWPWKHGKGMGRLQPI